MKIYNYSAINGEFLSESVANESPLEKGVFLIPALATDIQPPTAGQNEAAIFNGISWEIVPDFRNETYYKISDGSEVTFLLGESPDATVQNTMPQAIIDKREADSILNQKKADRDSSLDSLTHDFGDGRIMQVRPKDESNIRNAIEIMTANSIPAIGWVMKDDKKYDVTVTDLQTALLSGQSQALTIWNNFNP